MRGWRLDPVAGPLPGPVRGSDSLKFLRSPVIYKGGAWQRCVTGGRPGPSRGRRDTAAPWPPETPERSAALTENQERTLGGSPSPGGRPERPLPTPTRLTWDWEQEGEARPRPRTAPSGLGGCTQSGRESREGATRSTYPTRNAAAARPLLEKAAASGSAAPSPGAPQRRSSPGGSLETPAPSSASWRGEHLPSPSSDAALPLNLPPAPVLGRKRFHPCGDSPLKATPIWGAGGGGGIRGERRLEGCSTGPLRGTWGWG